MPSVIVQRFNFHTRACKSGENVSTYVSELRKLSEYCNFGDTLEDMLRDRLVCGINDKRVQRRLLAEPGLTFAKALELAQAVETAESNAKQLEQVTQSTIVHALSSEKKGVDLFDRLQRPEKLSDVIDVGGSTIRTGAILRTATAISVEKRDI